MNKGQRYCQAAVCLILLAGAMSAVGQVIFKEDFQTKSPVKFWTASGKYKINFMGLTTENARAGRKVFKLDISFLEDAKGYYYFEIPCRFAPPPDFYLKTRVLLGKESSGTFGLGVNVISTQLQRSGCQAVSKLSATGNKWRDLNVDIGSWLRQWKSKCREKYAPKLDLDKLKPQIDRIGLFLFGSPKRKRIVLYLDEIKVVKCGITDAVIPAGAVSENNKLERKQQQKLLVEYSELLNKYTKATGQGRYADNCKKFLAELKARQAGAAQGFVLSPEDYQRIVGNISDLKSAKGKKLPDNAIVYTLDNPVIDFMILPQGQLPSEVKSGGKEIRIIAAGGEFESFSILVKAVRKLERLTVLCDELKSSSGAVIPAANIDLKSVKCWYQSGDAWESPYQRTSRRVIPELLLNDDALVKVDHKLKTNSIKLRFPDGNRYWNVDDPKWNLKKGTGVLPLDKFPIRDAKKLLPLTLGPNLVKQFWGTVKVPKNAAPGIYTGTMKVLDGDEILARVVLKVRALPFDLPMPETRYNLKNDFICSIFYRSRYDSRYPMGTISSEARSSEQIAAELKNMYEHNIYNPNSYQSFGDKKSLGKVLELRNAAGMKGLPLYYIGFVTSPKWLADQDKLIKRVHAVRDFFAKFGIPEYYCFGIDEAKGKELLSQLKVWQLIRGAGGKIFITGDIRSISVVDGINMYIFSGNPARTKVELCRKKNKKLKVL
ncbi:MAG: hypothetical protein WCS27_15165, partial [Victivallaceae bacterium]